MDYGCEHEEISKVEKFIHNEGQKRSFWTCDKCGAGFVPSIARDNVEMLRLRELVEQQKLQISNLKEHLKNLHERGSLI